MTDLQVTVFMSGMPRAEKLSLSIILLGVAALLLEYSHIEGQLVSIISHSLDFLISILFVSGVAVGLIRAKNKRKFLKENIIEIVFVAVFFVVFIWGKYYHFFLGQFRGHDAPVKFIVLISAFNVFKVLLRVRKLSYFVKTLTRHPAQTIMFSFAGVILVGTILLMMPFSIQNKPTLGFINAFFTATSATCVTGLIVADTATKFSIFGKIIIMCLIQIGGLGIMVLAYFTAFLMGRRLSYQDKKAISYMLDEDDARNLGQGVKNIVRITFMVEIVGAMLLFLAFRNMEGMGMKNVFYSVFHSVSAFCNAGFALFTDNLEQYKSSFIMNMTISGLIIAGGISFIVMNNTFRYIKTNVEKKVLKRPRKVQKLTLNTKVVLFATALLLILGTLLIYKFEHRDNFLQYNVFTQYLMAFFQTVTLRTAGFNTVNMGNLHMSTYTLMILFMFIGGASGSCAGGIKVNTLGVIWGYVRSIFNNKEEVVLSNTSISKTLINQAFLVVFLALCVVFSGSILLTLTEKKTFLKILFEVTSAFGTVGLTAGITSELTKIGKIIITVLMFIGRLGPLTIIAALSQKTKSYNVKYPVGKISIG